MKRSLPALSLCIFLASSASAFASSAYSPVRTSPPAKAEKESDGRQNVAAADADAYGGMNDGRVESGAKSANLKSLFAHH
jgi:hypothetical protein